MGTLQSESELKEIFNHFFAVISTNAFGMKLDTFYGKLFVAKAHNEFVVGFRRDFQFSGHGSTVHDQRMITHDREGR